MRTVTLRKVYYVSWLNFYVTVKTLYCDINPLLGNGRKTDNYTTDLTRQWPINSNRDTVSSPRSVLKYKQEN
jgi:hypothetical protein